MSQATNQPLEIGLDVLERNRQTGAVQFSSPWDWSDEKFVGVGWASANCNGSLSEVALYIHAMGSDGMRCAYQLEMAPEQARAMAALLLHSADAADTLKEEAAAAMQGAPKGVVLQ